MILHSRRLKWKIPLLSCVRLNRSDVLYFDATGQVVFISRIFLSDSLKGWHKVYSLWKVYSITRWLIAWFLTPTLAVFQLYRGVNKLYIVGAYKTLRNQTFEIHCLFRWFLNNKRWLCNSKYSLGLMKWNNNHSNFLCYGWTTINFLALSLKIANIT